MKTVRFMSFLSAVALLAAATPVAAQESPFKFEFHGFVTGSMYYQDQAFGSAQGQGLLLASPSPAFETESPAATAPPDSGRVIGGDVRNSRFSFGVTGPGVLGGVPRGYLELDFFGPFNTPSAFGTEQPLPRIRVALAELKVGNTIIQVGQQNQLIVPQIPTSIAHIANPIPFGAGLIGGRTPGIRVAHTLPVGPAKVELAAEAVKNNWNNGAQAAGSQADPRLFSLGESGLPMFQARIKADGKMGALSYSAYVVGMYHQINLEGFGETCTKTFPAGTVTTCQALPAGFTDDTLDGNSLEVGGRVIFAPVTVAANYYIGKANGNVLGSIVQFGDIEDQGGWVNVGFNATKEFSVWGLYGMARPVKSDVRRWGGTRLQNDVFGAVAQYSAAGYRVGVEGYYFETAYATGPNTQNTTDALQVIGSVGYFF